ncbi:MAG: biosynthetic arginine decarboxylase [Deltaproteobacteria bacterium]|nr:biosynthetic arginine decarboxylase [Deltaproteobacteria bacterium]
MSLERRWTVQDSAELYHTQAWGAPYFGVNARGNVTVMPRGKAGPDGEGEIDLKELVDDLCRRGIGAPILLRFNDILEARVDDLAGAFATSIREYGYKGAYRGVMPIKVNQQRHVVEELVRAGKGWHLGLEAGSKAELLIAIALLESNGGLLILNGYKDSEYIETALHAQKLGLNPVLVLDRYEELDLVLQLARVHNVRPNIGVRVRLSSKGAGKWQESSGERSKFGLSSSELCRAVELLRQRDMLDCLKLQHFHIGSQITAIRSVKDAIREATRVYHDLRRMGAENLSLIDVGGGLAVDYDGSKTNFHSSRNYSNQEYANDIVSAIQDACDKPADGGPPLPHPTIVTEAGRALVAHHAVLVFNVLGTNEMASPRVQEELKPSPEEHASVQSMWEAMQGVTNKNFQESYNDALTLKDEAETLFAAGVIHLRERARIEDLFWAVCERVARTIESLDYVPEDLVGLKKTLSDTYYCNFSVFQSLPDSWAVDQLFPIVPLHRLDQEPTREAILADLTCDSDGKVDMFIDLRDVKPTLRLHPLNGQPYFLGAFLVGAYQETLGDLHNLFGDTNVVHVALPESGRGYRLEHVVEGDRVSDVLSYVEYDRNELVRRVRQTAEAAVRSGSISFEESAAFMRRYEEGLAGYTYLED